MGPCFPGCDSDSPTWQGTGDYPRVEIERLGLEIKRLRNWEIRRLDTKEGGRVSLFATLEK